MSEPAAKIAKRQVNLPRLAPEIFVKDAEKTIEVYKKAFGAWVRSGPYKRDGRTMHVAVRLFNDTEVFLTDMTHDCKAVVNSGTANMSLFLACKDSAQLAAIYHSCIDAGMAVVMPLEKQFWGDVYAVVEDQDGIRWSMSVQAATGDADPTGEVDMSGDMPPAE